MRSVRARAVRAERAPRSGASRSVFVLLIALLVPFFALAEDFVYVVKPGKTPLKKEPKLDAPSSAPVGYGQKLAVQKRSADGAWLYVTVPGDKAAGWVNAKAVLDKRPGLDTIAVADAASKVAASEGTSTAGAIRGLDGRTANYATAKQIPAEALNQLGRLEARGERQFKDPHYVDAKGAWQYRDVTAPGRIEAARSFAKEEGLKLSKPNAPSGPPPPTPPAPKPSGTPAP